MAKVSPKDKESVHGKQKSRRLKGLNTRKEYVKPGALAHQLRYSRITTASTKSCTDLGKKRIVMLDNKKAKSDSVTEVVDHKTPVMSPERIGLSPVAGPGPGPGRVDLFKQSQLFGSNLMSPERIVLSPVAGRVDFLKQSQLPRTPKTPRSEDQESESRLESLPMDILVKLLCHLHHDQLRPVFHVSKKIRKAVILARQYHFNYTTPDRARQEMLRTMTPLPTEHWPFVSKEHGKDIQFSSPRTPKAPRHGPRPPSRYKAVAEVRQITAVLFQESAFSSRCIVPPGLPKPLCKSFASNRALFCEDELCQAVAQNKLL